MLTWFIWSNYSIFVKSLLCNSSPFLGSELQRLVNNSVLSQRTIFSLQSKRRSNAMRLDRNQEKETGLWKTTKTKRNSFHHSLEFLFPSKIICNSQERGRQLDWPSEPTKWIWKMDPSRNVSRTVEWFLSLRQIYHSWLSTLTQITSFGEDVLTLGSWANLWEEVRVDRLQQLLQEFLRLELPMIWEAVSEFQFTFVECLVWCLLLIE